MSLLTIDDGVKRIEQLQVLSSDVLFEKRYFLKALVAVIKTSPKHMRQPFCWHSYELEMLEGILLTRGDLKSRRRRKKYD